LSPPASAAAGNRNKGRIAKEELTMIHPSTLAGPNWFTGNFGTTNPFQQNTTPFFRNTPFQGQQGGFGYGNNPFQNTSFGFGNNPFQNPNFGFGNNTPQFQNTISEIIRQTVPTTFANVGFQPSNGFQTPTGNWNTNGFQTPNNTWSFGTQSQNTPFVTNTPFNNNWQIQNLFNEMIRQSTNQAIQSFPQFGSTGFFQGTTWQNNPNFGTQQQQNFWNTCYQICQQTCFWACQTTCQAIMTTCFEGFNQQNTPFNTTNPHNIWNTCLQICQQACQQICQTVCQAVITCAFTCINEQNTAFSFNQQNTPFNTNTTNTPFNFNNQNTPFFNPQNTPFNFNTSAPQFSFTPGIPTGAGAF